MRTLFTPHLDGRLGADGGAEGAAVAAPVGSETDGMVSLGVEIGGGDDVIPLAGLHAEETFLAKFPVDLYETLQDPWSLPARKGKKE